jgi:hypothetical protein
MHRVLKLAAFAACLSAPALASETINYSYDVLGRLTTVAHSGTVNNGQQASYTHDLADNRTNVTVTGVPAAAESVYIQDRSSTTLGTVLKFNVQILPTPTSPLTFNYATADGTGAFPGVAGQDYTAKSGVVSVAAGQGAATISIQTLSGTKTHFPFFVNLSNPSTGVTLADSQGLGTINTGA